MSNIEWTQQTWNPISGCSRKSAGCEKCYAEKMTKRLEAMGQAKYAGLLNAQGRFNGTVRLDENALAEPLKRKKPTMYFVNSMSDLFHENIPDEWIDRIFVVMKYCRQHTFQVLTKRADRMHTYFSSTTVKRPMLPNFWLGVSVENQKAADERIPLLLDTPAAIRFISAEPLLERLDLFAFKMALDWVIVGGESGANARPCNVDWIRSVVAQCKAANVPVFVKQLGSYAVSENDYDDSRNIDRGTPCALGTLMTKNRKGGDPNEWPEDLRVREMPQSK